MEIIVAENAGFCFGVRRAVETVQELLRQNRDGRTFYTLGKLIHNTGVIAQLEAEGVRVIDSGSMEGDI